MNEVRRERWEHAVEWPLTGTAIIFLFAYAWPILDPALGEPWASVCDWTAWGTWGAFAADYVVRLSLSERRGVFIRRNLFDLAVVVLPLLRPLRLLRLVTLLSVLNRRAGASLRGRVIIYASAAAALLLLVAALAMLDAERGQPNSNINTFGDALWWAMTTVTTVGYGDEFPVTTTGRFIAGGLMIGGIALLGVVTATVASWLIERVEEVEEESQTATRRDVATLAAEVAQLRKQLEHGAR